ncbi:MAG: UbiX family flavin prenyltransferase [Chloroflexota bacterium]|nr:UbiX family flavin prenyltransferase [Chloroflexota bacterium]
MSLSAVPGGSPAAGQKPVVIGISGASGSVLARATVDALLAQDIPTILVCTNAARLVWQEEMDAPFSETLSEWQEHPRFTHYPLGDMRASIASGTFATAGMAIVPCSMNSIAAIAHGLSNNLLLRAADVCLKERRKLVLVPRETPLHATHLENMLSLTRNGATILPPEPAFYLKPGGVEDIARFVAQRVLVALNVAPELPEEFQYLEREWEE